jgi:hypothetical protein
VSVSARLDLAAGPFTEAVLTRVVRAVGAQADLDVGRLADSALVAEAVALPVARATGDGRCHAVVEAGPGRLVLRLGPLRRGGAADIRRAATYPLAGPLVDRLADRVRPEAGADGEWLIIEVAAASRLDGAPDG